MYRDTTQPPNGFSSPFMRFIVKKLARPFNSRESHIEKCTIIDSEYARDAFTDFREGNSRLLIPFRHVGRMDPPLLAEIFACQLEEEAPLPAFGKSPYWVHFLYGKIVLQWAGLPARWAFPRIGAVPVANQNIDRRLISLLKKTVLEGPNPVCFAPEGQVTYYHHRTGPLASGIAHFLKWNSKAGNSITILPVDIQYRYKNPELQFVQILDMLREKTSELFVIRLVAKPPRNTASSIAKQQAIKLLETALWTHLAQKLTKRLGRIIPPELNELKPALLVQGEKLFHLNSEGTLTQRLMRLRGAVFNRMHKKRISVASISRSIKQGVKKRKTLTPLQQVYQELQILDILAFYESDYLHLHHEANDYCLQAMNLLDLCNRMEGGDLNSRFHPKNQHAVVRFGKPYIESPGTDPASALDRLQEGFHYFQNYPIIS